MMKDFISRTMQTDDFEVPRMKALADYVRARTDYIRASTDYIRARTNFTRANEDHTRTSEDRTDYIRASNEYILASERCNRASDVYLAEIGEATKEIGNVQSDKDVKKEIGDIQRDKDVKKERDECSICLGSKPNIVFVDCHHMVCCEKCAEKLLDSPNIPPICPVCRTKIVSKPVSVFR